MNIEDIEALLIAALPALTSVIGAVVVYIKNKLGNSKFIEEVKQRTDHQDLVEQLKANNQKMDKLIEQNIVLTRKYNKLIDKINNIHTDEGNNNGTKQVNKTL